MKLIIGLGNIGEKYTDTRHNVGFLFLDSIENTQGKFNPNKSYFSLLNKLKDKDIYLVKPTTLMNSSGKAAKSLLDYFKVDLDDVFVIHDDLDIKLGEYKIQKGVGPKLHNGIESIEEELKSKDFWRIRVGVDNRDPENRTLGEAYVLQKFLDDEKAILSEVFSNIKYELSSMGIL